MSSKYTSPTGTSYIAGTYKSPSTTGDSGTPSSIGTSSDTQPLGQPGQLKPTTSTNISYQTSTITTTQPSLHTTYDAGTRPNYYGLDGSYNPYKTSYHPFGTSYGGTSTSETPSTGGSNLAQTSIGKTAYQPTSGGYLAQQNSYAQPKTNTTSPIQTQFRGDVKVGVKVEPALSVMKTIDADDKMRQGKAIFKQAMNKTSSTCSYEGILARLKVTGERFKDLEFPTDLKSLTGGNQKYDAKWSSFVWRTPDEFWGPGYAIFNGSIEPYDIKQGILGDCYFLSALSTLAQFPKRIQKLFSGVEVNSFGCYMVKICEMGEWKEIVVDEFFPCRDLTTGPIFTRANDHELWVLILEKAWAKIYGSYAKIEAGLTREVFHDLTGGPTEYFQTNDDDLEKIWEAIENGDKKNFAMTCSSEDLADGFDSLTSLGLVGSHAYSLLSACVVKTQNGPRRLVRLRNPWGESEWKGDWSDESSLWTHELKREVELEDRDDGIFFMAFEDFCKYFHDVQICRVHDDYEYSSQRFSADPKHATYLRFTITKAGHYYITVNQKSKRHFRDPDYEYAEVYLIVGKELPGKEDEYEYEYVKGIQRADREVWTEGPMQPGNYIAYVKVLWQDEQSHEVSISTYGYSKTGFETVPKALVGNFLEKVYSNKAETSPTLKSYAEEGEPNAFRCSGVTDDGFGYFFFWNKSESELQTEIFFKIMSGIKLRKPFSGKSFTVTVPPGEKKTVLTKVNPYFEPKQIFSEVATFKRNSGQLMRLAKEKGQKEQRKHQKTGEMVDIWCYVLQHSEGVFFYYENYTKNFTLDEEVKFTLQGLQIEDDPCNTSAKFVLPPGLSKEIKLKKTLNEFSIGFSTSYSIKSGSEELIGDHKSQIQPSQQLRNIAKEKGEKTQRQHPKTKEMIDIWCYKFQHPDGVYFYYENNSQQYTVEEELKVKLKNLTFEEDPKPSPIKFVLAPGECKEINLKKVGDPIWMHNFLKYHIKDCIDPLGKSSDFKVDSSLISSHESQVQPSQQLRNIAKEKGEKTQRQHPKTKEMIDIWCYKFQHPDGVYFYYENNSQQYTVEEELKVKLKNLTFEEDPKPSPIKFVLAPGECKEINLKKVGDPIWMHNFLKYRIKD